MPQICGQSHSSWDFIRAPVLRLAASSEKGSGRIVAQNRSTGRKSLETGTVLERRSTLLRGLAPTHHNCQARGCVSPSYCYFKEAASNRIQAWCECPRIGFAGLILLEWTNKKCPGCPPRSRRKTLVDAATLRKVLQIKNRDLVAAQTAVEA
jgi:hypothetical protein